MVLNHHCAIQVTLETRVIVEMAPVMVISIQVGLSVVNHEYVDFQTHLTNEIRNSMYGTIKVLVTVACENIAMYYEIFLTGPVMVTCCRYPCKYSFSSG